MPALASRKRIFPTLVCSWEVEIIGPLQTLVCGIPGALGIHTTYFWDDDRWSEVALQQQVTSDVGFQILLL